MAQNTLENTKVVLISVINRVLWLNKWTVMMLWQIRMDGQMDVRIIQIGDREN